MRSSNRVAVVLGLGVLVSAFVVRGLVTDRKTSAPHVPAPWAESLTPVEKALKARDVSAAMKAWHPVYAAALRGDGWEGLIAVGDAHVRIARAAGAARTAQGPARQIYLTALVRAQRDGSVEGAVRAATAFAALGDREIAAEAVRIAAALEARRAVVHAIEAPSL